MDDIEILLRRSRVERFAPGFSTRVVRRAAAMRDSSLGMYMQRYFTWLVPAAVTAILVLAIHNARATGTPRTAFEAVLALQPVTLNAAYSLDTGPAVR